MNSYLLRRHMGLYGLGVSRSPFFDNSRITAGHADIVTKESFPSRNGSDGMRLNAPNDYSVAYDPSKTYRFEGCKVTAWLRCDTGGGHGFKAPGIAFVTNDSSSEDNPVVFIDNRDGSIGFRSNFSNRGNGTSLKDSFNYSLDTWYHVTIEGKNGNLSTEVRASPDSDVLESIEIQDVNIDRFYLGVCAYSKGSVDDIQISVPSNPLDEIKGRALDLRPDPSTMYVDMAGTTPAIIGNPVGLWEDQSGMGHHVTQETQSAKPTLRRQRDGGYYLDFDEVDDHLALPSTSIGVGDEAREIVVATTKDLSGENRYITKATTGLSRTQRFQLSLGEGQYAGGNLQLDINFSKVGWEVGEVSAPLVIRLRYSGGALRTTRCWVNGTEWPISSNETRGGNALDTATDGHSLSGSSMGIFSVTGRTLRDAEAAIIEEVMRNA